ncbi:MAG: hypothetical protein O2875_06260 [Planctomycetota bacterium]|nr:hypothetical protein [Planctomycetota bacterium]MDA1262672.1 hypothetical protein [Planctomycetota bacterium]
MKHSVLKRSAVAVYLFPCVGFITVGANAGYGVAEATGAFQLPGASSTIFLSAVGAAWNQRIEGYDFGPIQQSTLTGASFLLQNFHFENYAYNEAGGNHWLSDSSTASIDILIAGVGTQIETPLVLNQTSTNGNNRYWQLASPSQNTNLAAGLANGSYSISFNVKYTYNIWDGSSASVGTASTGASTATFTVVPAPGAIALIGLAGLVARRRRA